MMGGTGRAAPRLVGNFYRRPTARYSELCHWLGLFALFLLIAALVLFRFRLIGANEFLWSVGAVAALGIFALFSGLAALRDIFDEDATGGGKAARGGLFAMLALAPLIWAGAQAIIHPKLNDVATDGSDFPVFEKLVAARAGTPWPSGQLNADDAAIIRESYPGLGPHGYSTDPARVAQAVAKLAAARRWETLAQPAIAAQEPVVTEGTVPLPRSPQREERNSKPDELRFEFVGRSLILNVPTDIAIRLSQGDGITIVDARAAGRHTAHDLGRGAAILTSFLDDLDTELLGVAGEGTLVDDDDEDDSQLGTQPNKAGVLFN